MLPWYVQSRPCAETKTARRTGCQERGCLIRLLTDHVDGARVAARLDEVVEEAVRDRVVVARDERALVRPAEELGVEDRVAAVGERNLRPLGQYESADRSAAPSTQEAAPWARSRRGSGWSS